MSTNPSVRQGAEKEISTRLEQHARRAFLATFNLYDHEMAIPDIAYEPVLYQETMHKAAGLFKAWKSEEPNLGTIIAHRWIVKSSANNDYQREARF